jgi:hypothetical protein
MRLTYEHQSDWLYIRGKFYNKKREEEIFAHEIFELDQKTRMFATHLSVCLSNHAHANSAYIKVEEVADNIAYPTKE